MMAVASLVFGLLALSPPKSRGLYAVVCVLFVPVAFFIVLFGLDASANFENRGGDNSDFMVRVGGSLLYYALATLCVLFFRTMVRRRSSPGAEGAPAVDAETPPPEPVLPPWAPGMPPRFPRAGEPDAAPDTRP
jgi:hypothetical protein